MPGTKVIGRTNEIDALAVKLASTSANDLLVALKDVYVVITPDKLVDKLIEYEVPLARATWMIRVVVLNLDKRVNRSVAWTDTLTKELQSCIDDTRDEPPPTSIPTVALPSRQQNSAATTAAAVNATALDEFANSAEPADGMQLDKNDNNNTNNTNAATEADNNVDVAMRRIDQKITYVARLLQWLLLENLLDEQLLLKKFDELLQRKRLSQRKQALLCHLLPPLLACVERWSAPATANPQLSVVYSQSVVRRLVEHAMLSSPHAGVARGLRIALRCALLAHSLNVLPVFLNDAHRAALVLLPGAATARLAAVTSKSTIPTQVTTITTTTAVAAAITTTATTTTSLSSSSSSSCVGRRRRAIADSQQMTVAIASEAARRERTNSSLQLPTSCMQAQTLDRVVMLLDTFGGVPRFMHAMKPLLQQNDAALLRVVVLRVLEWSVTPSRCGIDRAPVAVSVMCALMSSLSSTASTTASSTTPAAAAAPTTTSSSAITVTTPAVSATTATTAAQAKPSTSSQPSVFTSQTAVTDRDIQQFIASCCADSAFASIEATTRLVGELVNACR